MHNSYSKGAGRFATSIKVVQELIKNKKITKGVYWGAAWLLRGYIGVCVMVTKGVYGGAPWYRRVCKKVCHSYGY